MSKLDEIADFIKTLSIDMRAETLVSIIRESAIDENDLNVSFGGQLKRSYSKDVSDVKVEEFRNGEKVLNVQLNRDSVYDALPEALFHSFPEKTLSGGDEMARDSMKLRNEEKEARSFFMPFEHQIFLQLVKLSEKENALIKRIYSRLMQGLIPDFWNISREIPAEYSERLVKLIPLSSKIIGNVKLTTGAFEYILREPVAIVFRNTQFDFSGENIKPGEANPGLGEGVLGINMVSGDMPELLVQTAYVTVGPVVNLDVESYLTNGWLKTLFDCMCSYFFPMEIEVVTEVIPPGDLLGLNIPEDESGEFPVLGYNTVL